MKQWIPPDNWIEKSNAEIINETINSLLISIKTNFNLLKITYTFLDGRKFIDLNDYNISW